MTYETRPSAPKALKAGDQLLCLYRYRLPVGSNGCSKFLLLVPSFDFVGIWKKKMQHVLKLFSHGIASYLDLTHHDTAGFWVNFPPIAFAF
jgi:hypothetical protein